MSQMKLFTLFTFLLICLVSAQHETTSSEAGSFERLSVTFLNTVIPLDKPTGNISADKKSKILYEIKDQIMMKRFDYNPLPYEVETVVTGEISEMLDKSSGSSDVLLDQVTGFMNSKVVPEVIKYVDAAKELRARKLMTDQERNSFITDKAKEIGITAEQLKRVMNSAFIFVPVISDYNRFKVGQSYTETINVGIIWWKIEVAGNKSGAKIVVKELKKSFGVSNISDGSHAEVAFNQMAENGAKALRIATQQIPAFHLTGQILERNGNRVRYDLGSSEGVLLDSRYRIIELIEDSDGGIKAEKNGWIVVTDIADSSSEHGYASEGRIISGRPYVGALLHEYPRSAFELNMGYRQFSIARDTQSVNSYGFDITANYNFGPSVGVRQLYFGVGYSLGVGYLNIDSTVLSQDFNYDDRFMNGFFHLQLLKKFQVRRVLMGIEGGSGYSVFYQDPFEKQGAFTLFSSGNFEVALTPSVNIGGKVGWDWKFDEVAAVEGLSIGCYLSWTPPGMAVNPIDAVMGLVGL